MFLVIILCSVLLLNYGCFFAVNRKCLNFLFKAVSETILSWRKEKGFTPGFAAVMHTFGGILDFHPHIHVLIAEGGASLASGVWRDCGYFPHEVLKSRFRCILIKYLRDWSIKKLLSIPDSMDFLCQLCKE